MKTLTDITLPTKTPSIIRSILSFTIKTIFFFMVIFSFGFILPEKNQIPVQGASVHDWNPESFWYFPWGRSRVHRGLDIFAQQGTPVVAPTGGFVLFSGEIKMGGNVVFMIGPKWRFHYFAHLDKVDSKVKAHRFGFVDAGQQIGIVGTSGNAKGKPPHLHYSIRSLYPQLWQYKPNTIAAWDRLYFVNPDSFLRS
ncbi:MAG: murein DD-endopeptidase MepM/ murein hydrolase activator NlpD [Cocleimonas sp.]|jgi:murein DD-endopeptidase MepM/ murein hydrolase activator NlpD